MDSIPSALYSIRVKEQVGVLEGCSKEWDLREVRNVRQVTFSDLLVKVLLEGAENDGGIPNGRVDVVVVGSCE